EIVALGDDRYAVHGAHTFSSPNGHLVSVTFARAGTQLRDSSLGMWVAGDAAAPVVSPDGGGQEAPGLALQMSPTRGEGEPTIATAPGAAMAPAVFPPLVGDDSAAVLLVAALAPTDAPSIVPQSEVSATTFGDPIAPDLSTTVLPAAITGSSLY